MEGSEPSIRMRNSILAKEVTSWRRGKADDDDDDDEDDDSAAGDGRTVVALADEDVRGAALAVGANNHAALPNMSQHTHTTVRACVEMW